MSPHLYEENRITDAVFKRDMVLRIFGLSDFCLVSDGTIAKCKRRLHYDEPDQHSVYMFRGSIQRSIVHTENEQDYHYVGWIREHDFAFNEEQLLSEPGTKIRLV